MNNIDSSLIEAIATQLQQLPTTPERAREIASEIETLLTGLDGVLPTLDFLEEPDGFRAALWALRHPEAEGPVGE